MIAVHEPIITRRQYDCLVALTKFIDKYDRSPTMVELCRAMGVKHRNAVIAHVNALRRANLLRKLPGPRGIVLANREDKFAADMGRVMRRINSGKSVPYTASELGVTEGTVKRCKLMYQEWLSKQQLA